MQFEACVEYAGSGENVLLGENVYVDLDLTHVLKCNASNTFVEQAFVLQYQLCKTLSKVDVEQIQPKLDYVQVCFGHNGLRLTPSIVQAKLLEQDFEVTSELQFGPFFEVDKRAWQQLEAAIANHEKIVLSVFQPDDVHALLCRILRHQQYKVADLSRVDSSIRSNVDVVMAAIWREHAAHMRHFMTCKDLKGFEGCDHKPVQVNEILRHTDATIRRNKYVAVAAIRADYKSFVYFDECLKDDEEFVRLALVQSPKPFKFASQRLKENMKLVLEVVNRDGLQLEHVAPHLQLVREVVACAAKENSDALQFASQDIRSDRSFMMKFISQRASCMQYAHSSLLDDASFVLECQQTLTSTCTIRRTCVALACASQRLRSDKATVMKIVGLNGLCLAAADETLCDDEDVVRTAIAQHPRAYLAASLRLKDMESIKALAGDEVLDMARKNYQITMLGGTSIIYSASSIASQRGELSTTMCMMVTLPPLAPSAPVAPLAPVAPVAPLPCTLPQQHTESKIVP